MTVIVDLFQITPTNMGSLRLRRMLTFLCSQDESTELFLGDSEKGKEKRKKAKMECDFISLLNQIGV